MWSNVNVSGNERGEELAREGSFKDANYCHKDCFTFSEIASCVKEDINDLWRVAPVHEWKCL